jgi:hypothetical protein
VALSDPASYVAQSPDTTREADEILFALYRAAGPVGRIRKASALCASAERMALDYLRSLFPTAAERELRIRLLARHTPRRLVAAAFGWAPPLEECAGL